jgi:hypothetical protein
MVALPRVEIRILLFEIGKDIRVIDLRIFGIA